MLRVALRLYVTLRACYYQFPAPPRTNTMRTLLNPDQAGLVLGMHPDTVRRLARNGTLPGTKLGKNWRFSETDLQAFIDRCRPTPTQPEQTP